MKAKDKAKELVNGYRILLMNEDTECGNEILCTSIAKKCTLVAVDEIIKVLEDLSNDKVSYIYEVAYWHEVKFEINKL